MKASVSKILRLVPLVLFVLLYSAAPAVFAHERTEVSGRANAPANVGGAQAMLLARRRAILDLYRNLLRRDSVSGGRISGVRLINGEWDGRTYTVTGFIVQTDN